MIVQHPAYKTAQMCVVSPSLLLHKYPGLKHFWTKPRMWPYSGIMSSEPWRGRSTLSAYRPELQPLQSNEMYDLLMTEIFYALKDYQSILNNSNPKQPTSVCAGPDFICSSAMLHQTTTIIGDLKYVGLAVMSHPPLPVMCSFKSFAMVFQIKQHS